MIYPELIAFIKEARRRGFEDYEIRKPLVQKGWTKESINAAFTSLKEIPRYKNQVSIYLDSKVLHIIEKRAKRNMLSVSEQVEDIVRRSAVNANPHGPKKPEKLDDLLISLFSRRRR